MAMLLTRDDQLVLRHLGSGRSIEEIAAALNWPLQAMQWTCTYPLITWVLDELEPSTSQADSPWTGREVSQGPLGPRLAVVLPKHPDGYRPEPRIPHTQLPAPPSRKRTGMKDAALTAVGYAIGQVSAAIGFLVMVVVGGAIVLGFAHALGFFWRILTDG
jgi:hypothetical protein